jgi:hypothetical protein
MLLHECGCLAEVFEVAALPACIYAVVHWKALHIMHSPLWSKHTSYIISQGN